VTKLCVNYLREAADATRVGYGSGVAIHDERVFDALANLLDAGYALRYNRGNDRDYDEAASALYDALRLSRPLGRP
jgi:hypothetical protein